MSEYTEGPWRVRWHSNEGLIEKYPDQEIEPIENLTNTGERPIITEDGEQAIGAAFCTVEYPRGKGYETEDAERDANARLMASAPSLLDTAKACVVALERNRDDPALSAVLSMVEESIAKAEGRKSTSEYLSRRCHEELHNLCHGTVNAEGDTYPCPCECHDADKAEGRE